MTPTVHKGIVRAVSYPTADVEIQGSIPYYLPSIRVAKNILAAEIAVSDICTVVFYDEHNPTDAVIVAVHA